MGDRKDVYEPLVEKFVKSGDEESFTKLVTMVKDDMKRFVWSITRSDMVTDDICSETFIDMYDHTKDYYVTGANKYRSWVFSIARRNAINYLRDRDAEQKYVMNKDISDISYMVTDPSTDDESTRCDNMYVTGGVSVDDPTDGECYEVIHRLIDKYVANLPEEFRECVVLKYVGNLKYREISERLGVKFTIVKNRVVVGCRMVRESIIRDHPELTGYINKTFGKWLSTANGE